MVTAIMVKPGEHPCITRLCDTTDYLNCAVSIDLDFFCTASAFQLEKDIAVIRIEEDVSFLLTANRRIHDKLICGTFYIVGVTNGKLRSLTDREITKYTVRFWMPESFTDDEVTNAWLTSVSTL